MDLLISQKIDDETYSEISDQGNEFLQKFSEIKDDLQPILSDDDLIL